MGLRFNPFTGNFDFTSGVGFTTGGAGGSAFFAGEVATYADLPLDGTAALNSRWLVRTNSGTWPFSSYKQSGIYIRTATVGSSRDNDYKLTDTSFHDVMSDDAFLIFDNTDPTKAAKFDVGAQVGANQTRVITVPNKNITLDDAGDSRTPSSHTHGNLTNDGKIGTTANLPLKTGTNGIIEAGSFSNVAGSFCEGNDARLSDDRDPNLHAASHLPDGADELFDQSLNEADDVTFNEVTTVVVTCAAFADSTENTQLQFDDGVHRLINNLTETVTVSDSDASFAVPIAFAGEDAATNAATTRDNLGLGDAAVEDTTAFAASGSITTSGLTQATARILGRTTVSTGAIEEIQIGSGLSLSAGELSATSSGGISAVGASTADVLSVSGSDLVADDGGTIDSADPFIKWNDSAGKLVYANPLSRPSGAMYVGLAPTTTALGSDAVNLQGSRSAATSVASGANSVAIGNNSRAGNGQAVAIGSTAAVTGNNGIAIGRDSGAAGNDSCALGRGASSSQASSMAIGFNATASGVNSSAVGTLAAADLRAQFATLPFNAVYWGGQTTDGTANVELNLDATATNRMVIAANTAVIADIFVIARRTDNTKFLAARRWVAIRRDGSNNTALIGGVQTIETDQSEGSPTWTFTIDADDTASVESLRVRVTGAASETVNWRVCAIYRVVA